MNAAMHMLQQAVGHHQAGRLAEAEGLYLRVLEVLPEHPDALHLLGVLSGQRGKLETAVELVRRALRAAPTEGIYWSNLGKFLGDLERWDEAIAAYREALRHRPRLAEAHNNLGNLLKGRGQFQQAMGCYQKAMELKPDYAEARYNLGNALSEVGRFEEALGAYREALRLKPAYAAALNGAGQVYTLTGRPEDAAVACREALRLKSDLAEAWGNLGNALRDLRRFEEAEAAYRRALALRPADVVCHSNLMLAMNYDPRATRASIVAEAGRWAGAHAARLLWLERQVKDEPGRKLRIGYVSADFRNHPVAAFLEPLLAHHDRGRFEIVAYSDVRVPDATTTRLRGQVDAWHDTTGLGDGELAAAVVRDGIDVLVDLSMHSAYHRLLTFARKPAPVQFTWLAYPGTTGLGAIDFRITDPYLDPPATGNVATAERPAFVESFWCYGAPSAADAPDVGPPPCGTSGPVTFGCLNNFCKMSDEAMQAWGRILARCEGAKLILHARSAGQRAQAVETLGRLGVGPGRLEFIGRQPLPAYYATYNRIDVALDSFPCAGGTTTCDALWMGVPVVTLAGTTWVGRGGVSILTNAGFPEWIARDVDHYVDLAASLAKDRAGLAKLRPAMRGRLSASRLMDGQAFAPDMERAFAQAFGAWQASAEGRL